MASGASFRSQHASYFGQVLLFPGLTQRPVRARVVMVPAEEAVLDDVPFMLRGEHLVGSQLLEQGMPDAEEIPAA
jgi:hypothetical protein